MSINPYQIETSSDYQLYEFASVGRATIKKEVEFDLLDDKDQLYNLALCTVNKDGTKDYSTNSNNGDMDVVLETVAQIALIYSDQFPDRKIFFGGSDKARSRKYQMGINSYLETLSKRFLIEGVVINENGKISEQEDFQKGKNYDGFIFTRKGD